MLGWQPPAPGEAGEQLTLDNVALDCGENLPAEPEPFEDDGLSFEEWMRLGCP